ncbi:MAG: hypothetical protein ABI780_02225 [Ardenticatenales bacterium]
MISSAVSPVRIPPIVALFLPTLAAATAAAWAALGLAAIGRFDARVALGFGAVVAATVVVGAVRAHRAARWIVDGDCAGWIADAATLLVIALCASRLRPSVPWPAALDGGWYAASAVRIAHDRSLWFDVPAAAEPGFVTALADLRRAGIPGPDDRDHGLHAIAFAVPRIGQPIATPYHPPLFTTFAAVGVALRGPYGAAWAASVWAVLWLMAIAALCRLWHAPLVAPAATALAALSPVYRVYGATPYAELFAGTLALSAFVLFALADGMGRGRAAWYAMAGLLLGSAVVAKIDLFPVAAAGTLWIVLCVRGARPRLAFAAGGGAAGLAWLALARGPMAPYVALNGYGVWRLATVDVVPRLIVLSVALAVAATVWRARGRRWDNGGRGKAHRGGARLRDAAAWRSALGIAVTAALVAAAAWQWRIVPDAPVGMLRLLGWAISPLALFAAAQAVGRRIDRRAEGLVGLWPLLAATAFVLAAPIVTRDLSPIYTVRRLAPIALPTVCLLAAGELARGMSGPAWRRAGTALLAGLALVAAAAQAASLRPVREFGAVEILLDRIAAYARPGDLALFPSAYGDDASGRLAAPLWALHDVNVAVLPPSAAAAAPGTASAAARRWLATHPGQRLLWVADPATDPPAGLRSRTLGDESLVTEGWAPGVFPPTFKPVEFSIVVGQLDADPDNSR